MCFDTAGRNLPIPNQSGQYPVIVNFPRQNHPLGRPARLARRARASNTGNLSSPAAVSTSCHTGHVTYLETARNLGDALLVGANSDAAVSVERPATAR